MFERAIIVLKENGVPQDSFELQFAVYRNYSSGFDLILQSSPWESKPANLKSFLTTIEPEGG